MAKQQTAPKRVQEFAEVTCEGCKFIKPYSDLNGHGFCAHRAVKMIVIIKDIKPCILKEHG